MNKKEIQDLAMQIVGDGQTPNKFFVSISPYYMDLSNGGYILIEGYEDKDLQIKVFDTLEEADAFYSEQELSNDYGIGIVTIEDRLIGTIKEKTLQYYTKPIWTSDEVNYQNLLK